jgi:hypothetical protein
LWAVPVRIFNYLVFLAALSLTLNVAGSGIVIRPPDPSSKLPRSYERENYPVSPGSKGRSQYRANAYDPTRPCFTKHQMRRALGLLFGAGTGSRSSAGGKQARRWGHALNRAFFNLRARCRDEDFLVLVLTTIQLESGVSEDPALQNRDLEALFAGELQRLRTEIPLAGKLLDRSTLDDAVRAKLRRDTRRGKVRTEAQLVRYVEGDLRKWLGDHLRTHYLFPAPVARYAAGQALRNPVNTLGPMQINLHKATANARRRGEKLDSPAQMRSWLLDPGTALERGLREGIYQLWRAYRYYRRKLPAAQAVRFASADYNAGEFSSRNAAFQQRVARFSGHGLTLDGDLLTYRNGAAAVRASNTESAVITLLTRYPAPSIRTDLLLEKEEGFDATSTWKQVCRLQRKRTGKPCAVAIVPAGAVNARARIKYGRAYTPRNYSNAYLARWRNNRAKYHGR